MNQINFVLLAFFLVLFGKTAFSQQKKPIFISKEYYLDNQQKKPLYRTNDRIQAIVAQPPTNQFSFTLDKEELVYPTQKLPLGLWAGYSWLDLTPSDFNPDQNPQHARFAEWVTNHYILKDSGLVITKELVLDIDYFQSRYKTKRGIYSRTGGMKSNAAAERKGLEMELRRLTEDSTNAAYLLASAKSQQNQYVAGSEEALASFNSEIGKKSKQSAKWTELANLNQQINRELVLFQQNQDQKAAYKIADLTTKREQLLNGLKSSEPELLPVYENAQLAYNQRITNELNIKILEAKIVSLAEELRLVRLKLQ